MWTPLIYTPFTKYSARSEVTQGGKCGAQYMDFVRCASIVGKNRMEFDCSKELADFRECVYHYKQIERCAIMERERKRQKRPYIKPLAKDTLEHDYFRSQ